MCWPWQYYFHCKIDWSYVFNMAILPSSFKNSGNKHWTGVTGVGHYKASYQCITRHLSMVRGLVFTWQFECSDPQYVHQVIIYARICINDMWNDCKPHHPWWDFKMHLIVARYFRYFGKTWSYTVEVHVPCTSIFAFVFFVQSI